jgi:hypothetical protein
MSEVEAAVSVPAQERVRLAPVVDSGEFAVLLDSDRFAQIQRVANLFSESDLVPAIFQGKPANCAVALQMAFRMRVDPMMLMQNMYIIKGRPGIEAKLAIALMNSRGPFTGPLQWKDEGAGSDRSWTCFAVHRDTNQQCAATVTWRMVEAEGWSKKDGSKWLTIPDIMGRYRSAMFLGRLYCPEVLLGLPTDDELQDRPHEVHVAGERIPAEKIELPKATATAKELIDAAGSALKPHVDAIRERPVAPAAVDKATGEIKPAEAVAVVQAAATSGADLVDAAIANDPMMLKRLASAAQRMMIANIAEKYVQLNAEALDRVLADKFAFTLAQLPMAMVNECLQYIRGLKT